MHLIELPERSVLFREDEACAGFPFLLEGQVRVARGVQDGRELELYRIGPGEVCVVSAGCLLGSMRMTAHGVATTPVRLLLVDHDTLVRWTDCVPVRLFLLGLMADRMAELMALVEAVAFQRLDQRLAHALLGHGAVVHASHQMLADELGTVREIVTRLLKRFERSGWVNLSRERIAIVDAAALRALAGDGRPAGAV